MRNPETRDKIRGWSRMAARLGVLLTEPKVRAEIGDFLKHRVSSIADKAGDRYDETVHRMAAARDALRGKPPWRARMVGFLAGVGVGAGIGILLAPNSGVQTRGAVRRQAAAIKKRVVESASTGKADFGRPAIKTSAV
jgi:hypothetical protein